MSIERWPHMTRPSLVTVRRACFIVAALLVPPIPLVVYRVKETHRSVLNIALISLVIFCLTVTSAAYFKVFGIFRRHQQEIQAHELSQNVCQPEINFVKYTEEVSSLGPIYLSRFLSRLLSVSYPFRVISGFETES